MTCKDCIHYELCQLQAAQLKNKSFPLRVPELCYFFKDRSRFVELSSEAFTIVLGKVSTGRIDSANILLKNSTAWTFDSSHIGKEIFFTREEAEQALKERESGA